jgi:ABC-type multidrug transport system permease subunit
VLVPLAFTFFMGFAFRGPGDPSNPEVPVLVENRDTGFVGRVFLEVLGTQGLRLVAPTNAGAARRGVRIPEDFTRRALSGDQAHAEFFTVGDSGADAAALIEIRVIRALVDMNALLIEHAAAHPQTPLSEAGLTNLLHLRTEAVVLDSKFAGRKPIPSGFRLSIPGNIVVYLMMNLLIFGGAAAVWERRSGVLKRMWVQPVTAGALVAGKIVGLVMLGAVQSAMLLLAGRFIFGVPLGEHLPGIVLTLIVYSWVAASLGVLVGSIVRTEEKVIGICILASVTMAALGGCWWPLEIVPPSMKTLAHVVPTGWAMDALHQLISFGGGMTKAWKAVGVLAVYGIGANLIAARCFRA